MSGLGLVFIVAFVAFLVVMEVRDDRRRDAALRSLAPHLGGTIASVGSAVAGQIGGVPVWVRYTTRRSGKHTEKWTEIDADLPDKYPLSMFLRPHQWRDEHKLSSGEHVDIRVGNPAFDDAFLVEAAPTDVARVMLDDTLQARLLALLPKNLATIKTQHNAGNAYLRLSLRFWLTDVQAVYQAAETMAWIASRVRLAYAAVEEQAQHAVAGTPYRPMLDDQATRDAASARTRELMNLDDVRRTREAAERRRGVIIVVATLIGTLLVYAALAMSDT